jgi:hypothetical protein
MESESLEMIVSSRFSLACFREVVWLDLLQARNEAINAAEVSAND